MIIGTIKDKLMHENAVIFEDVSEDCDCNDEEIVLACTCDGQYCGYIAFDYDVGMYRFYHQIDTQQSWSEVIMYNIAEKLFILNAERKMN